MAALQISWIEAYIAQATMVAALLIVCYDTVRWRSGLIFVKSMQYSVAQFSQRPMVDGDGDTFLSIDLS